MFVVAHKIIYKEKNKVTFRNKQQLARDSCQQQQFFLINR